DRRRRVHHLHHSGVQVEGGRRLHLLLLVPGPRGTDEGQLDPRQVSLHVEGAATGRPFSIGSTMTDQPPPTAPLDQQQIARLVDRFYEKVRRDPMLGPVFNPAVDDWDEHKQLLTSFWSSVALGTRSYRG